MERTEMPLNGSTPESRRLMCEWVNCPFHNKALGMMAGLRKGKKTMRQSLKLVTMVIARKD